MEAVNEDQELDKNYDVHVPFVAKNGKRYRLYEIPPMSLCLTDRQRYLLNKVYGTLWMDAFYDPPNKEIAKYAAPLADMMTELNSTLHFKE